MKVKTYKTLKEVSQLIGVNTHVIRYWDSKLSISSQSNKHKKKFFNENNINQLKKLKATLYNNNNEYNSSLNLANKIMNKNPTNKQNNLKNRNIEKDLSELILIRDNLKQLLDKN